MFEESLITELLYQKLYSNCFLSYIMKYGDFSKTKIVNETRIGKRDVRLL